MQEHCRVCKGGGYYRKAAAINKDFAVVEMVQARVPSPSAEAPNLSLAVTEPLQQTVLNACSVHLSLFLT